MRIRTCNEIRMRFSKTNTHLMLELLRDGGTCAVLPIDKGEAEQIHQALANALGKFKTPEPKLQIIDGGKDE